MRPLVVGEPARAARGLTLAILAATLAAPGCRSGVDRVAPVPSDSERGRFPHQRHRAVACTECHRVEDVLAGRAARPGADDHAPCDRARCHQAEFLASPGALCTVCHSRVAPGETSSSPNATQPAPYPPPTGRRALAAEFSHATHLDAGRMEGQVGFHLACSDCHELSGEELAPPGHAVCGRCHAPEASPTGTPTMAQCARCHVDRPLQPTRLRRFIVGDLRFDHADHRQDRRGGHISCSGCHPGSAAVGRTGQHAAPDMTACVDCHDDSARTPPAKRMRMCEACHATKRASIGSIAPRSHLPALERPEDHTRAFRRDHAADASADPQRCARCHTSMSGSPRDSCDDCHRVMRPQDHTVTWREFDHGPASAARSDGCAVCHQGDFCISCHRTRPRSHFPMMDFAQGGHGQFARVNLRSCSVCH
ncbi:MAG TPA: hypothetical protein VNO33_05975, partial [Kofleriaceae bacterium]|nr:hypothetical protein [Kofleriaceae bacterium]